MVRAGKTSNQGAEAVLKRSVLMGAGTIGVTKISASAGVGVAISVGQGGAEFVSRAPLTGLGAEGHYSNYTFPVGSVLAGINADKIYDWRKDAGNALMNAGFTNFKDLYNNQPDPVQWDIDQLKNEQKTLQPIHEKYLKDRSLFTSVSKWLTDTSLIVGEGNNHIPLEKQGQPGGIDILDYTSRVRYGCKLLGYSDAQGCTP